MSDTWVIIWMSSSEHRPGGHSDNNDNIRVSCSLIMHESTYDTDLCVTQALSSLDVSSVVAPERYAISLNWVLGTFRGQMKCS